MLPARALAITWVGALALLVLLYFVDGRYDALIREPQVHVVVISLSIVVTLLLGAVSLGIFLVDGSVRALSLGIGFLAFAAIYIWHGVFTSSGHPFAFLIYGPTSRLGFGIALLWLASPKMLESKQRIAWIVAAVMSATVLAFTGFLLHQPISDWATIQQLATLQVVRLAVETCAIAVVVAALMRLLGAVKRQHAPADALMVASIALLLSQSVFFMATNAWTATWWASHAMGALSTTMLTGTVLVDFQQKRVAKGLDDLRDLNASKTQFINTAAHELGTPLTPIRLQIHLLKSNQENFSEAQKNNLKIIDRNVERLEKLSKRILKGAKSMAGKLEIQNSRFDLSEVVDRICASYRPLALSHQLEFSWSKPEPVMITSDVELIQDVIGNLLDNAQKYTPRGGANEVTLQLFEGSARITVRDTGIGLDAQLQERLFQPFTRGRQHDRDISGSGLGLFLSGEAINRLGGTLSASSAGPDLGTTFVVTIPLKPDPTTEES